MSVDTLEYVGFSPEAATELLAEYQGLCDHEQSDINNYDHHFGGFILTYVNSIYGRFDGDDKWEMTLSAIGTKRSVIRGICDCRFQDLRATRTPGCWFRYRARAHLSHITNQNDALSRDWWRLFPEPIEDLPSDHVMLHAGGPIYSMVRSKAWAPGCYTPRSLAACDGTNLLAALTKSVFLLEDRAAATRKARYAKAILPELGCGVMCIMVPKSIIRDGPECKELVWLDMMLQAKYHLRHAKLGYPLSLRQGHEVFKAPTQADNIHHLMSFTDCRQIRAQRFDGHLTMGYYIGGRALESMSTQCSEKCWIEPVYKRYDDGGMWKERLLEAHEDLLQYDIPIAGTARLKMNDTDESASETSPLLPPSSLTLRDEDDDVSTHSKGQEGLSTGRGILICFSIWLLIFMLTCNVSLMTTIQGSIATDLDAFDVVSWFTSAYLIAVTSLIPVAGRLSIIFTPRYYLFASIVVQSAGLLITSQARSFTVFLLGRAVTGIGGAAVTPVAFILVTDLTSMRRRGLLFGCINFSYTTGVSCGAIIAGAIEPAMGWRAVFRLQVPLTLSAALLVLLALPKSSKAHEQSSTDGTSFLQKLAKIDFFGIVTLISSVVLLQYGLSASKILITPIILSIADFILFFFVETRWAQDPIIPNSVLKSRANVLTGLTTIGIMTARWSILFYTPQYAIAVRSWSPATAGLMLIPTNVGFGSGGILVGWLHIKRAGSFYISCLVCIALFAASDVLVSQIATPDSNIYGFVTALFINGFITGALLNYSLVHLLHLTHPTTHPIVIPLNAMFRSLSASFGSSISGGIFLRSLQEALREGFKHEGMKGKADLIRRLLGSPRLVNQLNGIEHDVAVKGYIVALRTLFLAGAVFALVMLIFQAGTGWTAPESKEHLRGETQRDVISPVISRESVIG